MLTLDWNLNDALAVAREEGREDGIEEGREEGREEERDYVLDLLNQGLSVEEIRERLEQK